MRRPLFAVTLFTLGLPLYAAEPCIKLDDQAVASMFDEWNFALSSLDANQVTQRYWPDAVLMPTSNAPHASASMINDYFASFLAQRPRGRVDTRTIQSGCNLAVDMGTYTFSLMDDKGTTTETAARYTLVYQYRNGEWKILHHHSSAEPNVLVAAAPVVKDAEPAEPKLANLLSRRERKPKRKEYLEPAPAAAPVVAKADKPTPVPVPVPEKKSAAPVVQATAPAKSAEVAIPVTTKAPAEVRTAMFANLTSSPPPSKFYPPDAARRKEHGSVNLKVCADGTGAVSDALEVVRSSGSKRLDEAAMTWARAVTWVPATYNRQRVEGCASVDVSFEPPPA